MFAWAPLPPALKEMGSLEFSKQLLTHAEVAVAAAPAVAKILARELGWSPAREAAEIAAFGALAARYRPRSETVASSPPAG